MRPTTASFCPLLPPPSSTSSAKPTWKWPIRSKNSKLDGVYFIADTRREYPNGSIGGQVIGYCNVDGEGITGLELQYNDILSGTPGTYTAERGEQGFPIPGGVKEETPAVNGQDIMVSLDIKLQDTVEQALAEGVKDLETEEGSSIVMDAATGEIYAACSLPYMNPADMSSSQVGSESVKAITQAYEPGSTFKSVSALTILEQGTMGPEDTMFCPSSISADDYDVSDSHERDGEHLLAARDPEPLVERGHLAGHGTGGLRQALRQHQALPLHRAHRRGLSRRGGRTTCSTSTTGPR